MRGTEEEAGSGVCYSAVAVGAKRKPKISEVLPTVQETSPHESTYARRWVPEGTRAHEPLGVDALEDG